MKILSATALTSWTFADRWFYLCPLIAIQCRCLWDDVWFLFDWYLLMEMQYLEDAQLSEVLIELLNLGSSETWYTRHGSVLTVSSILRHNPSVIVTSPMFSSIIDSLKSSLKDEKVCILILERPPTNFFMLVRRARCMRKWEDRLKFYLILFYQTVPSSWNFNQGVRKTPPLSDSQ